MMRLLHDLLTSPERWTQRATVRTKDGEPTRLHDVNAASWCLVGAIFHCYQPGDSRPAIVKKLCTVLGLADCFTSDTYRMTNVLVQWNDAPERTFGDIQALLATLPDV